MTFAQSQWFLLLVPLAIWVFCKLKLSKNTQTALPYSDSSLLSQWIETSQIPEWTLLSLKTLGMLLLIVALARPQKIFKSTQLPKPLVDIVMALDTSTSMQALDFDPENRLEAAKKAAEQFILKRSYDRIGLVVFGGKAIIQCPLTLDHSSLIELLRTVPLDATTSPGTAIGTALALAAKQLSQSQAKTKIIILLTDGRSNQGSLDPITAAKASRDLKIKIYTIGTAVPGGGTIEVNHPIFGKQRIQTEEDLDEATLKQIAGFTQAKYFRVTSKERFKRIYQEIDTLERTKIKLESIARTEDRYTLFLLFSLLFWSIALLLENTFWRKVP